MLEIEAFIRDAAQKRGIDPDIAVRVALSEGGVTQYAAHGDFDTGDSWWPLQLHYGGDGYEKYGTVAGMGTGFTALTGWQPGDPHGWRDSVRYALNRAKASGWGQWYGAAAAGIGQWDGIDRTHPWDAAAERWDYETGESAVPKVTYDPQEPAHIQEHSYDCSQDSAEWAMWSLGRKPADGWMESQMIADGVMSKESGLLDATGAGLAAWLQAQYGEFGFLANNEALVSFDWAAMEGGHAYPILLGGRRWGHWSGCYGYDAARGALLLANPAPGWMGIGQEMTREQFQNLGPFSAVRIWHPDLLEPAPAPPLPPAPPKMTLEELRESIRAILAQSDADHAARSIRADLSALYDRSS